MTLYESKAVDKLIEEYYNRDPDTQIFVIEEGSLLGYGLAIVTGHNLKTLIIQEAYLNSWSSAYKIRLYNKTPKKYQKIIDEYGY